MLEARVTKQLRDFELDLSLHVENGSILALMGENGAGKSTTLNLIAGLLSPDAGTIRFNGSTIFDAGAGINVPVENRRIGYVFQKSAVFPHMTVRDNIAFGLRAQHRDPTTVREQVTYWLDRLDLRDLAGVSAARLSGGQKQRVALARVLATEPALLMLDEPFTGLDAESSWSVREIIRQCVAEIGIPCVLVTHRMEEARDISDNISHICRGTIVREKNSTDFF